MHNEEKWHEVINNNASYDGLFYYAVKTTKIFCRPSCRAKVPLRKNTLFFDSADEALQEGFRPCKMCRPDINNPIADVNKELIQKIKQELDTSHDRFFSVDAMVRKFGISERHLVRLFKGYNEITPNEYIKNIRISNAKILLKDTNKGIIDIAYDVGFKSISIFYKCFKNQVGTTPKQYRKKNRD